jgi:hypothetical protein
VRLWILFAIGIISLSIPFGFQSGERGEARRARGAFALFKVVSFGFNVELRTRNLEPRVNKKAF